MFNSEEFLQRLTTEPGVYQMLDDKEQVIYVGKAKNLKKRVSSYFRKNLDYSKTTVMVKRIHDIRIIVTQTENEALILENNLIKKFRPRYNILFKDDKSFPYLLLTQQEFPRLVYYRGNKKTAGDYFGPYPNGWAVRETLKLLQKIFLLRNCSDSFFAHRSRPCLQYYIKRCSGPCVGLIDQDKYQQEVRLAKLFLQGKNQEVMNALMQKMETASQKQEFEQAAFYRDQIRDLRALMAAQNVERGSADCDVIAIMQQGHDIVVQVLVFRAGKLLGNQAYFPSLQSAEEISLAEILASFVSQYYFANEERIVPPVILINHALMDQEWLADALAEKAGRRVKLLHRVRGERADWLKLAEKNALHDLVARSTSQASIKKQVDELRTLLNLPEKNTLRMECFDISHTQGESTVASCVVFDENGPRKTDYRLFNIQGVKAGDDYQAMYQALYRRYQRLAKEPTSLPDVLVIDGGKGQLAQAENILAELKIEQVLLLGIAKGPTRKAGLETLWLSGKKDALDSSAVPLALHLLQYIRDEAHRFAIAAHRKQRAKPRKQSLLESIEGIGDKKRQMLLKHFGGLIALKQAQVEEIAKVEGIGPKLAAKIYEILHVS